MATREKWIERVEKWERSGLGAAEFALREGLNPAQFERWCEELRAFPTPLAELRRQAGAPPAPAWIDIPLVEGGLVRLLPGVDAATLACVLAAAAKLASGRRT